MNDKELYDMALKTAEKAYAPYSGFKVGAALLTSDGHIFTGINIENASYGATICAERTAIVKAVSEGYKEFAAIAVASPGGEGEAWPCGICRQVMMEFSPDMEVVTGKKGKLEKCRLRELLAHGFTLEENK